MEKIKLAIPTINLLECRRLKGGYHDEFYGNELDASCCIADGPGDDYPDVEDQEPEYDPSDNNEYCDRDEDLDNSKEENTTDRSDDSRPENNGDNTDYDVNAAVEYLRNNAHASSQGQCAKAVREALEAGGLNTDGRPGSAKDYDDFLPTLGFHMVDLTDYTPQAGDIIVHEAQEGHPHGHIAMYDGEKWISDFEQRDEFGGRAYRENPDYTIWRR